MGLEITVDQDKYDLEIAEGTSEVVKRIIQYLELIYKELVKLNGGP